MLSNGELNHEWRSVLADLYIAAHKGAKAEPTLKIAHDELVRLIKKEKARG